MGRDDNIILTFAEYGDAIIDMLKHIVHSKKRDDYTIVLLNCCEQYAKNVRQSPAKPVTLSTREREVLSLAAEGLKRDEIAVRLMLSTGTIRTHLQNIYHKLGVGSKTAAIKKAEKLKLL